MALIETSDQLDLQGNGLLDFAEVRELAGAPADAAALSEQAARLFERKGNVVSALRARQLAERLLSQPDRRLGSKGPVLTADALADRTGYRSGYRWSPIG